MSTRFVFSAACSCYIDCQSVNARTGNCEVKPNKCFESGVCYSIWQAKADNPCRVCGGEGWFVNAGKDVACDDGVLCTWNDHCDGRGYCRGTPDSEYADSSAICFRSSKPRFSKPS